LMMLHNNYLGMSNVMITFLELTLVINLLVSWISFSLFVCSTEQHVLKLL